MKERQLKIKNEYLKLIIALGFDYDGFNTVEGLKALIDELVRLAIKALKNDDKSTMYVGNEEKNILFETIGVNNGIYK